MWSESAENLLLGTAAQESLMGTYLVQLGGGPALGIYQMEPATEKDCWDNFILHRNELRLIMNDISTNTTNGELFESELTWNLVYATAMARIKYYRDPEPLPAADDIPGLAAYWKRVFNTNLGKGTEAEFIDNYHTYVTQA
jgi:hypothetical protein